MKGIAFAFRENICLCPQHPRISLIATEKIFKTTRGNYEIC